MSDAEVLERLRAELRRRRAQADADASAVAASPSLQQLLDRFVAAATTLRAPYHDAQRGFYAPARGTASRKRAACTTRQSGKTSGGCRETLARVLDRPNTRWTYCNATLAEARKRAWRNDSNEGWLDLLGKLGLHAAPDRRAFDRGVGDYVARDDLLTIDFRNGSQLDIFAADDERALDKLRGAIRDGIWVDEAQKFPYLAKFINAVVMACVAAKDGEVLLTGTPDEFLNGLFFDVTRDDDLDARAAGWDVHAWSVLDNPGFGATRDERYARTIGREIAERRLDPNDLPPEVVREWLGRWVATAGRYVYRIQQFGDDALCYAPVRTTAAPPELAFLEGSPWLDAAAAIADLPQHMPGRKHRRARWEYGIGADFGFWPDPFAVVLAAWSPDVDGIWELWSWKATKLTSDQQRDVLLWLWGLGCDLVVGDAAGQLANMAGWQQATGLPIVPADKAHKHQWIDLFNGEVAAGRWRYRRGSALLDEHRNLLWRQVGRRLEEDSDRKLADDRVPGNHCSDAGLYLTRHLIGRRAEAEPPPPAKDSPAWAAREERRMRAAVDVEERAHARDVADLQGTDEDLSGWINY